MIINNIIAIYRKELQGYFASPIAYIITGVFWFISGFFLQIILTGTIQQAIDQDITGKTAGITMPPVDLPYEFLTTFLSVIGSIASFILPILSMGIYAEERKLHTLELLATSPLTNWSVAVGKLLGVVTFFITITLPLLVYEILVFSQSTSPISPLIPIIAHLGLILLAAAILSLGMFISSLTDSVILAAFLTFAVIIFLWIIDIVSKNIGGDMGAVLSHLSLFKHYNNLIQGIIDSSGIMMLISYIILGVLLTAQSIDSLRFQRN